MALDIGHMGQWDDLEGKEKTVFMQAKRPEFHPWNL